MIDPLCTASSRLPLEEDWLFVDPDKAPEVVVVPPVVVAPVFVPPLPRMLVLLDPARPHNVPYICREDVIMVAVTC